LKTLADAKFNKMEFAGALGDLGTFVPLFIALVSINGLNPAVTLNIMGVFYVFCGVYYKLPVPVQPLKAVAAIAIVSGLSISVISASAILMGIILLLLSAGGLIEHLNRIFSKPIIRGMQLGLGLMLIKAASTMIFGSMSSSNQATLINNTNLPVYLVTLLGGIIIMLVFLFNKRFPASIGIISFGIIISIFWGHSSISTLPLFETKGFNFIFPSLKDFMIAGIVLVVPQLPLTLGNSIVATEDTAKLYFGVKAKKVTAKSLSVGLGITNIIAGFFGGMPVCHGSGGLTAHYSFGARTGGAPIIIGAICLLLSLFFGGGVSEVLKVIPLSILGIMLFYVGLQHALLISDIKDRKELIFSAGVGVCALLTNNLAIAYGIGLLFWYLMKYSAKNKSFA